MFVKIASEAFIDSREAAEKREHFLLNLYMCEASFAANFMTVTQYE